MFPARLFIVVDGDTDAEGTAICEGDVLGISRGQFPGDDHGVFAVRETAADGQVVLVFAAAIEDVLILAFDFTTFEACDPQIYELSLAEIAIQFVLGFA